MHLPILRDVLSDAKYLAVILTHQLLEGLNIAVPGTGHQRDVR